MFQSRLEENASTFLLPLIDKPALFRFQQMQRP